MASAVGNSLPEQIMARLAVRPRENRGILGEEQSFQAGSMERHADDWRCRGRARTVGGARGAHQAPRKALWLAWLRITAAKARNAPGGIGDHLDQLAPQAAARRTARGLFRPSG